MRSNKFFYKLFILIVFLSFYSESRELSIKQLEERKQSDLERLKEREKKEKNILKRNFYFFKTNFFK